MSIGGADLVVRAIDAIAKAAGSGGLAGSMTAVGVAVAGAAIAIGVDAVKAAGDFQQSMNLLVTSAGESAGKIQMVSDGILQMSIDTGTTTDQLAKGMYFVESAGFHAADGLAVMQTAAEGAKVENSDLDTVAKALTTTMTDYHMKASDSAEAMNGLIATVQLGKTNLQLLSATMGNVLPIASSLGVSFADVAGTMDTMTNAGLPARQAAQNLAHVLVSLSAPSAVAVKAMTAVGLSAQQVKDTMVNQGLPEALQLIVDYVGKKFPAGSVAYTSAIKDITGGLMGLKTTSMITGASLSTTEDNIRKIAQAMGVGSGAVLGWDTVQGNFNFKLDQARQALQVLMIVIGQQLLPIVTNFLGALTPLISRFTEWIVVADHARPIIIGLAVALMISLVPAMWDLASAVLSATWPFVLIAVVVAGLVMLFQHFYETSVGFRNFMNLLGADFMRVWGWVQEHVALIIQQVMVQLQRLGDYLGRELPIAWAAIEPVIKRVWGWIQANVIPIARQAMTEIQALGNFISLTFGTMANTVATDTLNTKLSALNNTISQKQALIAQYEDQKIQIEALIDATGNEVERKALETKLTSINAAEEQAKGVVAAAQKQKTGVTQQLAQMDPLVKLHALQQKDATVAASITGLQQTVDIFERQKEGIIEKLQQTRDGAQRQALLTQLALVDGWETSAKKTLATLEKQKKGVDTSLKQQSDIVDKGTLGRAFAGMWERLQQIWPWLQANVPPLLDRISQGFAAMGRFIASMQPYLARVGRIFQDIGGYLKEQFLPVWTGLVDSWNKDILPSLKQLWDALVPLGPVLVFLAEVIGVILYAAIGLLWAIMSGLIRGLAGFLSELGPFIGGLTQMITGIVQMAAGMIAYIADFFSGHWEKLAADSKRITDGIGHIFGGFFQMLGSIAMAGIKGLVGLFLGFIDGIIGFFQHLYDRLVGHSIIPDMISAIIGFFNLLLGLPMQAVQALVNFVTDHFNMLRNDAGSIFGSMVSNLINLAVNLRATVGNIWNGLKNDFSGAMNALGGIASSAWSNVLGAIRGSINSIINAINNLIGGVNNISSKIGIPAIPTIPHLAAGTSNFAGGMALVGEQGPELVYLPTGTRVVPNSQLGTASGRSPTGGSGVTIIINLATMARTQAEMARVVDLFEAELAKRFRLQTSGYNSGNIY